MARPLMPKATAVWLVDNTALTFEQIADFCGLHPLEIQGIADGEVAVGIKGLDPISNGQLTREEIERCEATDLANLQMPRTTVEVPKGKAKGQRYTPVSKRQDRPNAIAWLVRYQTELTDPQIAKLVGTTKPTIQAIRDRSHWNMTNIKPQDPVTLGLCSQIELDEAVRVGQRRLQRLQDKDSREKEIAVADQYAAAAAAGMPSTVPVPEAELGAEQPELPPNPFDAPPQRLPEPRPEAAEIFGEQPEVAPEPEEDAPTLESVFRQE